MTRQISEERKTAYYLGMVLMVLGGILFASTFVSFAYCQLSPGSGEGQALV